MSSETCDKCKTRIASTDSGVTTKIQRLRVCDQCLYGCITDLEEDLQDALFVILLTHGPEVTVSNTGRKRGRLHRIRVANPPQFVGQGVQMVISEDTSFGSREN